MRPIPVIVPFAEGAAEAAQLIDTAATPLASVLDPTSTLAVESFRDAVVGAAIECGDIAGILFALRWGGGGVMPT